MSLPAAIGRLFQRRKPDSTCSCGVFLVLEPILELVVGPDAQPRCRIRCVAAAAKGSSRTTPGELEIAVVNQVFPPWIAAQPRPSQRFQVAQNGGTTRDEA
jgi:hypothetical protein